MWTRAAKKKSRILPEDFGDEDRISRLPDELIHKILSFLDAKVAVQTSTLSRRWKPIWTTLPYLNFDRYDNSSSNYRFLHHVLSNRNHESHISELNLCIYNKGRLHERFVKYAISHNVQSLNLELLCDHKPYKLSAFSSNSLKKLTLRVQLEECGLQSDWWDLPALTTLHLKHPGYHISKEFPDLWFTCLPSLKNLYLDHWSLSQSLFSSGLPTVTTLRLSQCTFPRTGWDFPALSSLDLYDFDLPYDMTDVFSTLVNLQNLTLYLATSGDHFISCPQLLNLNIRSGYCSYSCGSIVVSAPKLCNFTSFGIFTTTVGVPELENVNIRLQGWFKYEELINRKRYYRRLTNMLAGLGNAKNLTFDLESIEALNEISNILVSLPSPFCKLKYVKLPWGYKESNISSALRSYLLGGSPRATIVTTLTQNNVIPQTVAVSVTAQNMELHVPLTESTKELVDSQYLHQTLSVDTLDTRVQEEPIVEDSVVDADWVRHNDAPVKGTGKDQVSSSRGNRDFGLWQGHEVNFEFVCMLDCIMHKYPETFENFFTENKKLCTMNLIMLCTSLNDFMKISMTEVNSEMIVGYRDVFAYLQNQGFNVSWVVNRLNYIEHLRFSKPLITELYAIDSRIDDDKSKLQELQARVNDAKTELQDLQACVEDAKTKFQDVQTLRMKKLTEIEKDFGTMGYYL